MPKDARRSRRSSIAQRRKPVEAKAPAAAKKAGRQQQNDQSQSGRCRAGTPSRGRRKPRPPCQAGGGKARRSQSARSQDPEANPAKTAAVTPAAPKPEAAKAGAVGDALAGIPPAERSKIQAALLWSGDYAGAAGGDDPMVTAIKNFQKRHKAKITGVLTPSERADLVAAAKAHEDEFGWSVVVDPATGIRIGLPTKLVPQARDAARGTRWSSAHGEVQVETFRIKQPELTLAALFEQREEAAGDAPDRNERAARRRFLHRRHAGPENVLRARQDARRRDPRFHHAVRPDDGEHRRAGDGGDGEWRSRRSPSAARRSPRWRKPVEYGTGLVVSAQGHIVTDLAGSRKAAR